MKLSSVYTRKARWMTRLRHVENDAATIVIKADYNNSSVTAADFVRMSMRIYKLGRQGEDLWRLLIGSNINSSVARSVTTWLGHLEDLSQGLYKVAERQWAEIIVELANYQFYHNEATFSSIKVETKAKRYVEDLLK